MAEPKCQKGDIVSIHGMKIFSKVEMQGADPDGWRTLILTGRVTGRAGGRKAMVMWNLGSIQVEREVGSRALTVVSRPSAAAAPPPPPSAPVPAPPAPSEDGGSGSDMDIDDGDEDLEAVPDPEPQDADDAPLNESLVPGGLAWMPEPDGIQICPRATSVPRGKFGTRLKWPRNVSELSVARKPIDYWNLMMPDIIDKVVNWSNDALRRDRRARVQPFSKHEIVKWIGICFAMTMQPVRTRRNYWATMDTRLFPAPRFGERFGMGATRFDLITKFICFHNPILEEVANPDPWLRIRYFVDSFNMARYKFVMPGWALVIDESTTKWRGLGDWYDLGMPHITKIPRKPEPIGLEIKDMCDGTSHIMLHLEIMEGKDIMKEKGPDNEPGEVKLSEGTKHCLRAIMRFKDGAGRVVMGDSAFASVQTAVALKKAGFYFLGNLKGASKLYPKRHLQTMPMQWRGQTATFTAQKDGVGLIAHVWNDPGKPGKPRKTFISTYGLTSAVADAKRPRKRKRADGTWEQYFLSVPRTQIVKDYMTHAGCIDRHNRVRMDGIRLERTMEFKTWHLRCLTSLLGFVATDAFYAMRLEQGPVELDEFMEALTESLIFNMYPGRPETDHDLRSRFNPLFQAAEHVGEAAIVLTDEVETGAQRRERLMAACKHTIMQLRLLPKYKEAPKVTLTCGFCKRQTACFYCVQCSRIPDGRIFAVCGPATKKQCMSIHCAS